MEKVVDKKWIDSKQAEEDEQTAEQEEKIKEAKKQLDEPSNVRGTYTSSGIGNTYWQTIRRNY